MAPTSGASHCATKKAAIQPASDITSNTSPRTSAEQQRQQQHARWRSSRAAPRQHYKREDGGRQSQALDLGSPPCPPRRAMPKGPTRTRVRSPSAVFGDVGVGLEAGLLQLLPGFARLVGIGEGADLDHEAAARRRRRGLAAAASAALPSSRARARARLVGRLGGLGFGLGFGAWLRPWLRALASGLGSGLPASARAWFRLGLGLGFGLASAAAPARRAARLGAAGSRCRRRPR